ncbi:PssD/Cps14F family polysaccharide biosynthesis glycosyltransferase [Marinilactibacillus psychrotolerans]|uniref:PssD/Cps14F family polysaccharide biosynthesis glycosyltransferase n=1 Tax=Marinilactibacillus psychrotolerans TaxID=191770 RepID=UPI00388B5F7D
MKKKVCLISSSGGHYEQLKMLDTLKEDYDIFYITEKTSYKNKANYYLIQTGCKDKLYILKMSLNLLKSIYIFLKERPYAVVTTGSMVAIPISLIAKLFRRKLVYIESFARVTDSSKTGRFLYNYADLFIVQWETMKEVYPNAVYGGSLY